MARTVRTASRMAATLCRSSTHCVSSAAGITTTTTSTNISHYLSAATTARRPSNCSSSNSLLQLQQRRTLAGGGWDQRGYDITAESLDWGERPKVIVEAHAPTGFDVRSTVRKITIDNNNDNSADNDNSSSSNSSNNPAALATSTTQQDADDDDDDNDESDGTVHMNGSVLVFPYGCFLWKMESAADVTVESLAPVLLHRPKLDYLFVGCNKTARTHADGGGGGGVPREQMERIQEEMSRHGIVAEQLDLGNAIGTFNILNAEDRMVACALVIDRTE